MALFNHATKEVTAKLVYYGPGLCGKTTNLQWIHANLAFKSKGKLVSLATQTDRTLFFDFLPIELGTIRGMRTRVQLYTVPGQVFYETTRRMVLKGCDAVVFVADSQAAMLDANFESLQSLRKNLLANEIDPGIPMVLQYNKRDLATALPISVLDARLNPRKVPTFESVAFKGTGVEDTLRGVTKALFRHLSDYYGPGEKSAATAGDAINAPGEGTPAPASAPAAVKVTVAVPEPPKKPAAGPIVKPARKKKPVTPAPTIAAKPAEPEKPNLGALMPDGAPPAASEAPKPATPPPEAPAAPDFEPTAGDALPATIRIKPRRIVIPPRKPAAVPQSELTPPPEPTPPPPVEKPVPPPAPVAKPTPAPEPELPPIIIEPEPTPPPAAKPEPPPAPEPAPPPIAKPAPPPTPEPPAPVAPEPPPAPAPPPPPVAKPAPPPAPEPPPPVVKPEPPPAPVVAPEPAVAAQIAQTPEEEDEPAPTVMLRRGAASANEPVFRDRQPSDPPPRGDGLNEDQWLYLLEGAQRGPIDIEDLVDLVLTSIPEDTKVWHPGLEGWVLANKVRQISEEIPPPLPVPGASRHAGADEEMPDFDTVPPQFRTALIADEDEAFRKYLAMPLAAQGFTIHEAADGSAAWQLAVQNRPWLILADVSMPEVDGFEFCQRVRNHPLLSHTPLLFISGDDNLKSRYRALQLGADDFLSKQMPIRELLMRIQLLLTKYSDLGEQEQTDTREGDAAGAFQGRVEVFGAPALLQMCAQGRLTGIFTALSEGEENTAAVMNFREGDVISATVGAETGLEAAYAFLAWPQGSFKFTPGEPGDGKPLAQSVEHLLLEGCRLLDESQKDGEQGGEEGAFV